MTAIIASLLLPESLYQKLESSFTGSETDAGHQLNVNNKRRHSQNISTTFVCIYWPKQSSLFI